MRECLKFLVAGDRGVGKSTLIQRLCYDKFTGEHRQTVGVDFYRRSFQLNESLEAEIEICDLAGDAINSKMLCNYLKNVNAIILAYDTTNRSTLQCLGEWHRRLMTELGPVNGVASQSTRIVLLGCKTDLVRNRQVSLEDHKKMIEQLSAVNGHFCSAKLGEGVIASFRYTAAELLGIDSKTVEDKTVFKAIVVSSDNRVIRRVEGPDPSTAHQPQSEQPPHRPIQNHQNKTCSIQ